MKNGMTKNMSSVWKRQASYVVIIQNDIAATEKR